MIAIINVRQYGGTYIARAKGHNVTASCTCGAREAAACCATKLARLNKGAVLKMKRYGRADTWVVDVTAKGERRCRVCLCTEDSACVDKLTGEACHWVEADLCSACAPLASAPSASSCAPASEARA